MEQLTKKEAHEALLIAIDYKINTLEGLLQNAINAVADDTKSTAGDKHETSRAMAQIEQEKLAKQLSEAQNLKALARKILQEQQTSKVIGVGSFLQINKDYFLLSVPFGKFEVAGKHVFALSPVSPIGQVLIGKKSGDTISFKGEQQKVLLIEI